MSKMVNLKVDINTGRLLTRIMEELKKGFILIEDCQQSNKNGLNSEIHTILLVKSLDNTLEEITIKGTIEVKIDNKNMLYRDISF